MKKKNVPKNSENKKTKLNKNCYQFQKKKIEMEKQIGRRGEKIT